MPSDVCIPCRIKQDERAVRIRLVSYMIGGLGILAVSLWAMMPNMHGSYEILAGSNASQPLAANQDQPETAQPTDSTTTAPDTSQNYPSEQSPASEARPPSVSQLRDGLRAVVQKDLENTEAMQTARIRSITVRAPRKDSPAAKAGCDYIGQAFLSAVSQPIRYYHYPGGAASDWTAASEGSQPETSPQSQ
jgi:hypothetical protein